MLNNLYFISQLNQEDFPFERIDSCLNALKYLSKNYGLEFIRNKDKDKEDIKVIIKTIQEDPISNKKETRSSNLLEFTIDHKEEAVIFN